MVLKVYETDQDSPEEPAEDNTVELALGVVAHEDGSLELPNNWTLVPDGQEGRFEIHDEENDVVAYLDRDSSGDLLSNGDGNGSYTDEDAQDAIGTILENGLTYDDDNTIGQNVVASGQIQLSSGTGVVDTDISATDATFQLALGIGDPDADAKIAGRLFWDDSSGTYKIEIVEDGTSIGNLTVNYDVVRVR